MFDIIPAKNTVYTLYEYVYDNHDISYIVLSMYILLYVTIIYLLRLLCVNTSTIICDYYILT
jgi:hypothetical protein